MIGDELLVRLLETSVNIPKTQGDSACISSMFQVRQQGGGLGT